MPNRHKGRVIVGPSEKDGYLLTLFEPPIRVGMLWEATTGAFSIHEIVRDKKDTNNIRGIIYQRGDLEEFDNNLARLTEEVEKATGYRVTEESKKLGAAAVESVVV